MSRPQQPYSDDQYGQHDSYYQDDYAQGQHPQGQQQHGQGHYDQGYDHQGADGYYDEKYVSIPSAFARATCLTLVQ
jgi:1,3-beta-glucan synthase